MGEYNDRKFDIDHISISINYAIYILSIYYIIEGLRRNLQVVLYYLLFVMSPLADGVEALQLRMNSM